MEFLTQIEKPSLKRSVENMSYISCNKRNSEFSNLPIDLVIDGCLDTLGKFNKQHITLTFILKQGVWFFPQEMKDLMEKDEVTGQVRDRIEVVKERLNLKQSMTLKANPKVCRTVHYVLWLI